MLSVFNLNPSPRLLMTAALTAPLIVLLYVLCLCVYRFTFHPFAKYPGPFWAKVSYWHAFYHAWKQDTMYDQWRLHEKYGPVVRYTPDNLLFNYSEAQKDIHAPGKNFIKGKAYAPMNIDPSRPNLAFTPHKQEHGRRRRIIGQGFSDTAMREAETIIMDHINDLCSRLLEKEEDFRSTSIDPSIQVTDTWTAPKNMANWTFWMALDITTDLIFGKSYEMLRKPDMRDVCRFIQGGLIRNSLIFQYPGLFRPGVNHWLDFGTWFLPNPVHMIQNFLMIGTQSALGRIESHKTTKSRKDVLSILISAVDPLTGTTLDAQDVIVEANILLLAGGDTISTGLCTTLFYLSRNLSVYTKLASEIRSTFQSRSEISLGPKLNSCIYLRACLEEGLRLFGGPAFWRDADEGGATVCGEHIPAGYTVGYSMYALHHREDYFPSPFKYDPERWIPSATNPVERVEAAKAACNTFSLGPRSCVAKNLAMTVMLLTLTTMMWDMDFRVADGEVGKIGEGSPKLGYGRHRRDEYQLYGSFTLHKDGPVLQFKKRQIKQ